LTTFSFFPPYIVGRIATIHRVLTTTGISFLRPLRYLSSHVFDRQPCRVGVDVLDDSGQPDQLDPIPFNHEHTRRLSVSPSSAQKHTYPATEESETPARDAGPIGHFGTRIQQEPYPDGGGAGKNRSRNQHDGAIGTDLVPE
jgi:hypothetical protein